MLAHYPKSLLSVLMAVLFFSCNVQPQDEAQVAAKGPQGGAQNSGEWGHIRYVPGPREDSDCVDKTKGCPIVACVPVCVIGGGAVIYKIIAVTAGAIAGHFIIRNMTTGGVFGNFSSEQEAKRYVSTHLQMAKTQPKPPPTVTSTITMAGTCKSGKKTKKEIEFSGDSGAIQLACFNLMDKSVFRKVVEATEAEFDRILKAGSSSAIRELKYPHFNCAEKDVFNKVLNACEVKDPEDLKAALCRITSWSSVLNVRDVSAKACHSCCVFLKVLYEKVADETCKGKDVIKALHKGSDCNGIAPI